MYYSRKQSLMSGEKFEVLLLLLLLPPPPPPLRLAVALDFLFEYTCSVVHCAFIAFQVSGKLY